MTDKVQNKIYEAENLIIENRMLLEILRGYCNNEIYSSDSMANIVTALDIIIKNQKFAAELTAECQQYFVL